MATCSPVPMTSTRPTRPDILPLTRVKPEELNDYEAGANWQHGTASANVNLFAMEFSNEIAPIGALSLTGNQLSENVGASYRRGIEFDGSWRVTDRLTASGNLTLMTARIKSYLDQSSGTTYNDVEPLLTPPLLANAQLEMRLTASLSLTVSGRYVDSSHLDNTGDANFMLPSYWMSDASLAWHVGKTEIRAQVYNLFNANAYASGYDDGSARYFYPIATRNVLLTTRIGFLMWSQNPVAADQRGKRADRYAPFPRSSPAKGVMYCDAIRFARVPLLPFGGEWRKFGG